MLLQKLGGELDQTILHPTAMNTRNSVAKLKTLLWWAAALGTLLTSANPAFSQIWASNSFLPDGLSSAASSADGTTLVAAGWPSVYTSTNSGATWTSNNVPKYWWTALASSADGTHLVASSGHGGPVYTSTNSGATWTSNSLPVDHWYSVASSADGTKLVAVVDYGGIFTSTM